MSCFLPRPALALLILLLLAATTAGQETPPVVLPDFPVVANRAWSPDDATASAARTWEQPAAQASAFGSLDQLLANDPTFALYRRQDATFAHPTAQGANLRALGASAASRALVLRDGIPQNDPFGGWVNWARYLPASLRRVDLMPGGQAAAWGNLAAGGVIALRSLPPGQNTGETGLRMDHLGGAGGWLVATPGRSDGAAARLALQRHHAPGPWVVHPDDRGPLDRRADLTREGAALSIILPVRGVQLSPSLSWYEEERGNGTPEARNTTRAFDLALQAAGAWGDYPWHLRFYRQDRDFANQFTAVNDVRTGETPVLHQFAIPAEGTGAAFTVARDDLGGWRLLGGLDAQRRTGTVNENYGFRLPNQRRAGGEQELLGLFVQGQRGIATDGLIDVGLRFDHWALRHGFLTEASRATGEVTRSAAYPDRDDVVPSLHLGYTQPLRENLTLALRTSHGFRLPTINELYRPFRVGSDITAANPALEPERLTHVEITTAWQPSARIRFSHTLYAYQLDDTIANVYLFDGPADSPAGPVPAGGTFRQRLNVAEARVYGWHPRLTAQLTDALSIELDARWTRARFTAAPEQPLLEDRTFPQIPNWRGKATLRFAPVEGWDAYGRIHYTGDQWEDTLNTRELPAATTLDLGLTWQPRDAIALGLHVLNATDEIVLTGIDGEGLRDIAPQRRWVLTGRWAW